jgi:probable phosphoglycerate mutase
MFDGPDECTLVAGDIHTRDTCDEWEIIPPTVYVFRHGSTAENRGGPGKDLLRGHTDIPMSAKGVREVAKTADVVAHVVIPILYCSDLRRAVKTAEIISSKQIERPTVYHTERLRTWDLGDQLEGQLTTPRVLNRVKNYIRHDDEVPPGGEAFGAYVKRIVAEIGRLFERTQQRGGIIGIVSHGRTAQVLDLWVAARCDEACMKRDYRELLADEPSTLQPGGAARYCFQRGRWRGEEIIDNPRTAGTQTIGTKIAATS